MKKAFFRFILMAALCALPSVVFAQVPLDPASLLKPLSDSWPTYSGDYTGRRYSSLTQANQATVKNLALAWIAHVQGGPRGAAGPVIVAGEGPDSTLTAANPTRVGGTILAINGILYFTTPNNVWAMDARDGRELWHFFWKHRGGTLIGNRGVGMYGNWLFFETPDDFLVSLDARTGKERWHKPIADFREQYFSTMAPVVIGNHILVGTGNNLDSPAFLQSFDPETGDVQWKSFMNPMKAGDPGLDTWPSLDAAQHGGGQTWIPGSYDPETHLYIVGTANPTPAYTVGRGDGDNLFTCSLVALDIDTGKMKWYFQTSPHETHDWDSTQTPILADAMFRGRMRKLVMQATRNGYFFVLDRVTGEHLVTAPFAQANWAATIDKEGHPRRNPEKDPTVPGSLVSPTNGGSTNWPPPAFSPEAGLFYVRENNGFAMYYLTETDPRGSMGLGGKEETNMGSRGSFVTAIDYKTGKIAWRRESAGGAGGLLTTVGKLLFAGDGSSLVAYDVVTGKPLWHSRIGGTSNAPETYLLDGHQYVTVAVGDMIVAFVMN